MHSSCVDYTWPTVPPTGLNVFVYDLQQTISTAPIDMNGKVGMKYAGMRAKERIFANIIYSVQSTGSTWINRNG